ncbi:alpha/beta hydrolase [Paucibacter sp. R3-3]|uniref:Alpha/beta hydrolase n=1 Tax=Roseateles agri TaxID=3098619 RepID=A0ABU5DP26_9BURK|nr:alpha/beta hydrolase [Paucibacter sp. R3-3]MDY0748069.1 alpha/beta hydrolase [Paucibacter sp. R3-3]
MEFKGSTGLRIAADVGGDPAGAPVILMHGGGQTRHSWGTAFEALTADGFRVINLDARGHGDSEWAPDGDYSLPTLADDLRAVMSTLDRPPALVGASMGGATGLLLVGNSPPAIARALVLVDIVPRLEITGSAKVLGFMRANVDGFASLDEAADAVTAYNPHRPRPKDPSGLMKNLRLHADGRLYWHWDPKFVERRIPSEPPAFIDSLVAACTGVHIPTLLVRGMKSDIVSEAGVADLRRLVPQTEVFDVPGAGHMVAGDRNDAFNASIIEFLRRTA